MVKQPLKFQMTPMGITATAWITTLRHSCTWGKKKPLPSICGYKYVSFNYGQLALILTDRMSLILIGNQLFRWCVCVYNESFRFISYLDHINLISQTTDYCVQSILLELIETGMQSFNRWRTGSVEIKQHCFFPKVKESSLNIQSDFPSNFPYEVNFHQENTVCITVLKVTYISVFLKRKLMGLNLRKYT